MGALLHVLSVASLLEGLPGHVLLDVLALLPGGGDTTADLVRDVIADFTWGGDIIANLLGNLVAFPASDSGALALRDFLGLDPGHQGADTPGLLLAVPDGNLLARLAVQLLAVHLGHLDTSHLGDIRALLTREAVALTLGDCLTVSLGDVLAFL